MWTVSKTSSNITCSVAHTTCNTISAAVTAAASGDIIVVGPGKYKESVTIGTGKDSLSIFGAQAGKDAREGRDDPSKESIVDASATGQPTLVITVPFVVIDGFTIKGGSGSTYPAGVVLAGSSTRVAGLQVFNNIIKDNGVGVLLYKTEGNVVERNLIEDNNTGTEEFSGYGVFASDSVALNISDNAFEGNHATAVKILIAEFATVTNNTSENDGSFAVFVLTEGGLFKHNQGRNFGAKGVLPVKVEATYADADAAVDISWGNQLLEISDNDLEEGQGTISNGIAFTILFGTSKDSEGVIIKNNRIKGFKCNGIVAETDTTVEPTQGMTRYSSIVANDVEDNGKYGINIEAATTYNTNISFFENEAKGNDVLDCNDDSVASGPSGYTLGTHDTWYYDIGSSSYPTGICTPSSGHHHDDR